MRTASLVLFCLAASSLAPSLVGCGPDDPPAPIKGKKPTGAQAGSSGAGGSGTTVALGGQGGAAAGSSAGGAPVGGGPGAGSGGATAGTGGAPLGGSGGVGAGAGTGGSPSGGTGGAPAPVKKKGVGYAEFFAGKATASTFLNGGSARFVRAPSAGQTPACVAEDLGGVCKVEVCAPTAEMIESSGTIDVQVATITQLHLVFDEGTKAYSVQEATLPKDKTLAKAGDIVTMLASGFDAPSFNADVTFPEALTLSLPAQASPFLLDTATDLAYQVSGSGTGSVEIVLASVKKDNPLERVTVTCSVPAGAGKLPSAALKKLPVADAAKYTSEITVKTVTAAPAALLQSYDVTLRAATHALDDKGAPWTKQTVTLK